MPMIRTLVVEDFPLILDAVATALEQGAEIAVVGRATSGRQALELAHELEPDVVVLDLRLPDIDGLAVLARLRAELPRARVLMLTADERAESLLAALDAGAAGYLTKRTSGAELRRAVRSINAGESVVTGALAGEVVRDWNRPAGAPAAAMLGVTEREREVIALVARGATDRGIAERLGLSPHTVSNHLRRIRDKTGRRRRSELTRWALEQQLVY
jgi:DNA-binding NarL/FixJ family response regulator